MSFYTDNDDLRFYFDAGVDWASLVDITEYGFRAPDGFRDVNEACEFYRDIAELVGQLTARELAPRAAALDREHPRVVGGEVEEGEATRAIFKRFRAAELHRLCLPRELGGLNAPLLLYFLVAEMIARGDVSVMTHFSFHGGMAMAMLAFSIHEGTTRFDAAGGQIADTRFADAIQEIAAGDAWGCMDITEPDAGSDMAALRTRAEQDAEGSWFVTGQKIFITSGHGRYHFVIARTEPASSGDDPFAGLGGLSMFLVRAWDDLPDGTRRRHVQVERVEDKLGHNSSVTAALSFDRAPAQLIGRRGEGFRYMLTLMNNARIGVGFESIGLAESALRMATEYAAQRRSMGKPIAQHEMIADWLDEMRTDVQALRALAVKAAVHEELAQKMALFQRFDGLMTDAERQRIERDLPHHRAESRRLTPLLKYLAAEKAVEIARRNLQIHGGVGYTREFGAEKLLRDALVLPIYEGTSQIQALMAMKDALMGILKHPGEFVSRQARARLRALRERDPAAREVAAIEVLSLSAQQHLMARTAVDKVRQLGDQPASSWLGALRQSWDPKRDFALAMLHAERLTRLMALHAISAILLDQARQHPQRRELLERWLDRAPLQARALHAEITTVGAERLARITPHAAPARDAATTPRRHNGVEAHP